MPSTLREALEIGLDHAKAHAAQVHESLAGYLPRKHEAADEDVRKIEEALASLSHAERAEAAAPAAQSGDAPLCWVPEDELPESLTDEAYSALFSHSKVDFFRLFPIFGPPAAAALAQPAQASDDVLEALEMNPESFRTEGGTINRGKLRAAILHPQEYLPPSHWLQERSASFDEVHSP